MFDVLGHINWLGVAVGFVAFTALGGLWFALLFAKPYNRSLGRAEKAAPVRAPLFFAGPPLATLFITVATAVLMSALHVNTFRDALLFALIAGIGYLGANTTNIAINPNFPRPLLYAAISGTYNLVGILLVSVVVVFFQ